ncbi:tetratricopeptide repeat protein [Flammeovirga aprica]|uniref:Tetratricopeptide repeat protein n=1 Tax=Flammeovirga aprica JL-4 TaxID=694437 RepID=A0A7X9P244_9BACT|nr:tetratricopeptide repeat protein [Flammeovirga aprica]NME67895.1 tetratricopeptide repeat protein [Flammeovirga aprica JL-4]
MPDSQNNIQSALEKFELMEKEGRVEFFDLSTFEEIIEHYFVNFNINKALKACEVANSVYPFTSTIKVLQARILAFSGDYTNAFAAINEAEQIAPTDFNVLFHKGSLHSIVGEVDKAINSFETALPYAENPADIYYNIGITLQSINEFEKAIEAFKKSIESDMSHENTIYELVDCCVHLQQTEELQKFLQHFVDNDPYNIDAWYNLGIYYSQIKAYDNALKAFDYAILIDDTFESAHMQTGHCYMNLKKYAEAFRAYLETLQHSEEPSAELYCHLGASAELMKDYNVGIRYFKKAIETDENYDEAWFGTGENHRLLGNYLEATHYLTKAVKLNKFYDEYWFSLALAETALGNLHSGLEAFEEACRINPNRSEAWIEWSMVYYNENETEEAIVVLKKALEHLDENHSIHYRLAGYYMLSGKLKDAYKHIEIALRLNYDAHTELVDFIPNNTVKKILESAILSFRKK